MNNISEGANERNSNIELLRIFAMVMILVYHCFMQLIGDDPDSHTIRFFYTILHNGVPLFMLISGFFTINLNAKKLVSFYLYCVIWAFICYGMGVCFAHQPFSLLTCFKQLFPFSHPTVWYPPFYFWLMILSPILNSFCKNCNFQTHGLVVLGLYMTIVYFGVVWHDNVVNEGKSVVQFIFMYLLGAWIRRLLSTKERLQKQSLCKFVNFVTQQRGGNIIFHILPMRVSNNMDFTSLSAKTIQRFSVRIPKSNTPFEFPFNFLFLCQP